MDNHDEVLFSKDYEVLCVSASISVVASVASVAIGGAVKGRAIKRGTLGRTGEDTLYEILGSFKNASDEVEDVADNWQAFNERAKRLEHRERFLSKKLNRK